MFFFQSKLLIHVQGFFTIISKAYYFVLMIAVVFLDMFCICDLRRFLVTSKKYTNAYGQNSNYTNAIDLSITEPCGKVFRRRRGRRCRVIRKKKRQKAQSYPQKKKQKADNPLVYFLLTSSCTFRVTIFLVLFFQDRL